MIADPLGVTPESLSYDERLSLLSAIEHERAALDAQQQRTLALLAADGGTDAVEKHWVREEVAALLRLAPTTAGVKLAEATELVDRLPATLDRLVDASITMGHVRAILEAVRGLDDATAAKLERRVLARAETQTVGEFRRTVKRALLALDPRTQQKKHEAAHADRRVRVFPDEDGMAVVWASLRADTAQGLWAALDAHAHALPTDGDDRTMDQKRADVLADLATLALNNAPGTRQGQRPAVQVSVALSTLLELDDQPGELAGYGPIPAELARAIAADPSGTWRPLVTDRIGRLVDYDRKTYRPPADLRDTVLALYGTCTFPGCRNPACKGQLDHVVPYPDGPTAKHNLHPPCSRHHHLKHDGNWRVRRTSDGTVYWTSPSGREYETEPPAYPVDTTADPDPPPY